MFCEGVKGKGVSGKECQAWFYSNICQIKHLKLLFITYIEE